MTKQCKQCWKWLPVEMFFSISKRGEPHRVQRCQVCQRKYSGWTRKSFEERLATRTARPMTGTGYRVSFTLRSGNKKTGPIPVSITDRASCPPTCTLRDHGCYAEEHLMRMHWDRTGTSGMSWSQFCEEVRRLPAGTLWRHNEAGDLPGLGAELDAFAFRHLIHANGERRGFTFTHKHRSRRDRGLLRGANSNGFTVNLSADSLAEADRLASYAVGPVVVTLPQDAPLRLRTPAGRRVVICPAQTDAHLTCATCELCAQPQRKAIIGFRAHGTNKALVSQIVRERRP